MSKRTVKSIDEFLYWAAYYNMPLEQMRFFVGVDNTEPKCYGIYQDESGAWVVYKNKANGQRAVRYRGYDEAEACSILWDKLEEETRMRKKERDWWRHQEDLANDPEYAEEYERELENRVLKPNYGTRKPMKHISINTVMCIVFGGIFVFDLLFYGIQKLYYNTHPQTGYYTNNNDIYYYQYPTWYMWDSYDNDWYQYDYDAYDSNYQDWNYNGNYYVYDGGGDYTSFQNSDYYVEPSHSSSSYDSSYDSDWSSDWDDYWDSSSDYDYDFSDWDSGSTDWDSDW